MIPGSGRLDPGQLERAAEEKGFPAENFEKVLRLLELLAGLTTHPFLQSRLALKGGTALNLFLFDLPRLSVDLDLNYVGAPDLETMLSERPKVEKAIQAACERQGFLVRRVPSEHAGGKWRLGYERAHGGTATLELDLNFLHRIPLWPLRRMDSPSFLGIEAKKVPLLDLAELAAGKLAALFSRSASRDLYDVVRIFDHSEPDGERLRLAFLVYGAMSRRDWRKISPEEIDLDPKEARSSLLPMVQARHVPPSKEVKEWCRRLVLACRNHLSRLFPFRPREKAFLRALLEEGEIQPELLTSDEELQERIRRNPGLLWKAYHVKIHRNRMDQNRSESRDHPPKEP